MPVALASYRYGDVVIASEWPLADLPAAPAGENHWEVRIASIPASQDLQPYHTWADRTGQPLARFVRIADGRLLDFSPAARFSIDAAERVILCEPGRAAQATLVTDVLTHEVLPLAIGMERLTLHASSVALNGRALVFAGTSGSGKSTLALRLAQQGWSLLTDDVAVIDSSAAIPHVLPIDTPLRLWPDSLGELLRGFDAADEGGDSVRKRAVSAGEARISRARTPVPLHALFVLDDGGSSEVTRVESRSVVAAVLAHAFVLATDDRSQAARLFEQVSQIAECARIYRLSPPPTLEQLDRVLRAALAAAEV